MYNEIEEASDVVGVNETDYDPRKEGINQLLKKRQEDLKEEGLDAGLDPDEVISEEEIIEDVVEDITPNPSMHKIKVNGKELELSYEELVERAQKVEAADEYLRKAKELSGPAKHTQPSPDVVVEEEVDDLELVRAIQMGSEEEATAALRKLRQSVTPTLNKDDLMASFDEKLKAQSAYDKFARDFSDIVGDPILSNLAVQEDARLMASGDRRSYDERYAEVGNNIRSWRDKITKHTNTNEEKIQRKINAPSVPKAAGRQVSAEQHTEREETHSEMIARIAKARGQMT